MRAAMLPLCLLGLTPAVAEEPATPTPAQIEDAGTVVRLNRTILDNNQAVRTANESAEAAYRQERARYEAALAENGKARAEAAAAQEAFNAASRQHDADMAQWRASPGVKPAARTASVMPVAVTATPATYATGRPISVASGSAQMALDAEASRRTKLVCHTRMDTGSLVKRTRTCGSAENWRRRIAGEQSDARDMVKRNGDNMSQP